RRLSVVIWPESRSMIAQVRPWWRRASALVRRSSARPETKSAYPIRHRSRFTAGAGPTIADRPGAAVRGTAGAVDPDATPPPAARPHGTRREKPHESRACVGEIAPADLGAIPIAPGCDCRAAQRRRQLPAQFVTAISADVG